MLSRIERGLWSLFFYLSSIMTQSAIYLVPLPLHTFSFILYTYGIYIRFYIIFFHSLILWQSSSSFSSSSSSPFSFFTLFGTGCTQHVIALLVLLIPTQLNGVRVNSGCSFRHRHRRRYKLSIYTLLAWPIPSFYLSVFLDADANALAAYASQIYTILYY